MSPLKHTLPSTLHITFYFPHYVSSAYNTSISASHPRLLLVPTLAIAIISIRTRTLIAACIVITSSSLIEALQPPVNAEQYLHQLRLRYFPESSVGRIIENSKLIAPSHLRTKLKYIGKMV